MSLTVIIDGCESIVEKISELAPTFVFTRAGGWLTEPRVAAEEMLRMLDAQRVSTPYLLVGSSYAAFTHLLFAFQWPELVAGIVLVDPSHPKQSERALSTLSLEFASRSEALIRFRTYLSGFGSDWELGCQQVAKVNNLGSIPLVVLAAGAPEMPEEVPQDLRKTLIRERNDLLLEFCQLTKNGVMEVVEGSGHDIAAFAPDVLINSIRSMIGSLKS